MAELCNSVASFKFYTAPSVHWRLCRPEPSAGAGTSLRLSSSRHPTTRLTRTAGAPISDDQIRPTAGPRVTALIEDYNLLEKLAHQAANESLTVLPSTRAGAYAGL